MIKHKNISTFLAAMLFVLSVALFVLQHSAHVHAATLSDGTWSQSGAPGVTSISYVTTSPITAGDKIVLTFPTEAVINGTGTNIIMSNQTSPVRVNDAANSRIVITTDSPVGSGVPITIAMSDALSSYNSSVFNEQTLAINHISATDTPIDSGLAVIGTATTVVSAVVPGVASDLDGDGIPDILETGDRDNDGIPDYLDYDPTGYLYDEDTGEIIPGGSLEVDGPGVITVIQDGSKGYYQWITDGTPGIYTVAITPPSGYVLGAFCQPQTSAIDPTGGPSEGIFLGNDRFGTTRFLANNDCTTYYFTFDLVGGDPFIYHNNYPLTKVEGDLEDTGQVALVGVVGGLTIAGFALALNRRARVVDKIRGRGG